MSQPQMKATPAPSGGTAALPRADAGAAAVGAGHSPITNALTVDVEDYFQVQAFADRISRDDWDSLECRVERNTDRVLELFAEADARGTFFTLGWVAERYPRLIERIVAAGHELASHGYAHIRADSQTRDEFRADIRRTKQLLEDIGGVPVNGYRAATFSIGSGNMWAYDVLADEGYVYSSSIYPVRHDFYGMPDAPRFPFYPAGGDGTYEIPMTTLRMFGRNLPCSGGGYFRLLPYGVSRWQIRRVNREDRQPGIFYFHPWEVDPDQPRQTGISAKTRVRHYTGLRRMQGRLRRLLTDFAWGRMDEVYRIGVGETA